MLLLSQFMKKRKINTVFIVLLTIFLSLSIVSCSNNNLSDNDKTDSENQVISNDNNQTEVAEEPVEDKNESANEFPVPTSGPIDVSSAIVEIDAMPLDKRYEWYAERFGTVFTDSAIKSVEHDLIKYNADAAIPCDLLDLLLLSSVDLIGYYPTTTAEGVRISENPELLKTDCTVE